MGQHAPAERAADAHLLLRRAGEPLDRGHGVLPVLVLGLDVDRVELERPIVETVVRGERAVNHVGADGATGYLHLDREPERAEALLEGRPAEEPHGRGRTERRRERQGRLDLRDRDPEPIQELLVQVDVRRLADVPKLAGQIAGDGAEDGAVRNDRREGEPGRDVRRGRRGILVRVLRPPPQLRRGALAGDEPLHEAAARSVILLEGPAFLDELPRGQRAFRGRSHRRSSCWRADYSAARGNWSTVEGVGPPGARYHRHRRPDPASRRRTLSAPGETASLLDGRAETPRRSPGSEILGPGTHRVEAPTNAPDGEPPHPSSAGLGGGAEGIVALSDGE